MKVINPKMASLFLQKVKDDITQDTQYDFVQSSHITEEQNKLKNILRNLNQETYHILNRFIYNPNKKNKMRK